MSGRRKTVDHEDSEWTAAGSTRGTVGGSGGRTRRASARRAGVRGVAAATAAVAASSPGALRSPSVSRSSLGSPGTSPEQPRMNLREFAGAVATIVRAKQCLTYHEVGEWMEVELGLRSPDTVGVEAADAPASNSTEARRVRRRVYDSLNVLQAAGVLSREGKLVRWVGLGVEGPEGLPEGNSGGGMYGGGGGGGGGGGMVFSEPTRSTPERSKSASRSVGRLAGKEEEEEEEEEGVVEAAEELAKVQKELTAEVTAVEELSCRLVSLQLLEWRNRSVRACEATADAAYLSRAYESSSAAAATSDQLLAELPKAEEIGVPADMLRESTSSRVPMPCCVLATSPNATVQLEMLPDAKADQTSQLLTEAEWQWNRVAIEADGPVRVFDESQLLSCAAPRIAAQVRDWYKATLPEYARETLALCSQRAKTFPEDPAVADKQFFQQLVRASQTSRIRHLLGKSSIPLDSEASHLYNLLSGRPNPAGTKRPPSSPPQHPENNATSSSNPHTTPKRPRSDPISPSMPALATPLQSSPLQTSPLRPPTTRGAALLAETEAAALRRYVHVATGGAAQRNLASPLRGNHPQSHSVQPPPRVHRKTK